MNTDDIVMHCLECKAEIEKDDLQSHPDDSAAYICQDCYDEKFTTCDCCDNTVRQDETTYLDSYHHGSSICNDCINEHFFTCNDCGGIYPYDNNYRDNLGNSICEHCYSDNYFTCDSCENTFHNDDYGDNGCCTACTHENQTLHNYSYKPVPQFFPGYKTDNLYLGVELEVDRHDSDSNNTAEEIDAILDGKGYLKEDGSLDHGFEVVTHPCTLEYHKTIFPWSAITSALKDAGYKSHDTKTCGLHVHINKDFLSETERIKLGIFINTQQAKMEKIARRSETRWAKYKKLEKLMNSSKNGSEGRYEALNWQNDNTVEFRIFKGTLKLSTLLASVEIVDAAARFVKTVSTPKITDTVGAWKLFIDFIYSNKKTYSSLIQYLIEKGV